MVLTRARGSASQATLSQTPDAIRVFRSWWPCLVTATWEGKSPGAFTSQGAQD